MGLAQLFASIVAGLLWDQIGHTAVFYYGATFGTLGSIALVLLISASADPKLLRIIVDGTLKNSIVDIREIDRLSVKVRICNF